MESNIIPVEICLHTFEERNLKAEIEMCNHILYPFNLISVKNVGADDVPYNFRRPISSMISRQLEAYEINEINLGSITSVKVIPDSLRGRSYLIVNATYNKETKEVRFYCKNMETKTQVYECKLTNIETL